MPIISDAPVVFYALDVASALAAAYVAVVFLRSWRVLGRQFLLATAIGFALLAAGLAFVAASELGRLPAGLAAAGRYWGQMTALFVLMLSYVAARWGGERLLTFVAIGVAAAQGIVLAVGFLTPPLEGFPQGPDAERYITAISLVLAALAAAFASHSLIRAPHRSHLAVPGGFLFLALSQYTWLLDFGREGELGPLLAYVWQIGALGLFVLATVQRGGDGGGVDGPA